MGPIRKEVLDKAAWAWADNVEPTAVTAEHVETAYRIQLPECLPGTCKRNCRGSPRCLSGLGEHRWLSNLEESTGNDSEDLNSERRENGSFIGLQNLGATCYVNSLLQLWFHNVPFRRAIYEWDPREDLEERHSFDGDSTFPSTSVGHLQVLFANLQFGNRKYIDPSGFIHSLGLDTSQQQDAQEFSKLFISMLEDKLAVQSKPSVREMINKYFRGEYLYVTRCSKCCTESTRPSTFYELDLNIQSHRTLGDSLSEFLHEEQLEGANRYHCVVCGDKQDATRSIRLRSMPPFLHLQLLRFVYDRQKGHKKKLNSNIQFPEKLDMSEYVGKPPGSLTYNLSAVLVHMGSSAYSGHYVAHIRDSMTGTWYRFNDESVERMEGKKLKLGTEEDGAEVGVTKKGKNQRIAKGVLVSKNAYMLVYSAASGNDDETLVPVKSAASNSNGVNSDFLCAEMQEWGLEPRLQELVNTQNRKFEEWTKDEKSKRETTKFNSQIMHDEMRTLCNYLVVGDKSKNFDFVSMDWLSKCLHEGMAEDAKVGPINNEKDICIHGRVDPSRVTHMKCINSKAADQLYQHFLGGPRLQSPDSLCYECVVNKCREMRLRAKITVDSKEITNLLKYRMDETEPGYWVGKSSLKKWRSLALQRLNVNEHPEKKHKTKNGSEVVAQTNGKESEENNKKNKISSSTEEDSNSVNEKKIAYSPLKSPSSSFKRSLMITTDNVMETTSNCSKVNSKQLSPKRLKLEDGVCDSSETKSRTKRRFESISDISTNGANHDSQVSSTDGSDLTENQYDQHATEHTISSECSNEMEIENEALAKFTDVKEERKDEDSDDHDSYLDFNEDIICLHGNLNIDEGSRRLVVPQIWSIFRSYFPTAKDLPRHSPICTECQASAKTTQEAKDTFRKMAQFQKDQLHELFQMKNRPNLSGGNKKTKTLNGILGEKEQYFLIPQSFVDQWKSFISRGGEQPLGLVNEELICYHRCLLYDPMLPEDSDKRMVLLWPHEWEILSNLYSCDRDLSATKNTTTGEVEFNPGVCSECQASRLEAQQAALSQFNSAKIYVRRVNDEKRPASPASQPLAVDPSDPEFTPQANITVNAATTSDHVRRSARSRRPRGDKELVVSSSQTLLDLKKMICRHFQVAPFDQHLTLDGRELDNAQSTLAELNVYPKSVLLLRADEPTEDVAIIDDFIKSVAPEEGFKGTGLLSR